MFYTAADLAQLASSAREGARSCGGPRKSAMQILQDNMSRANKAEATEVSTVVVTCMNI